MNTTFSVFAIFLQVNGLMNVNTVEKPLEIHLTGKPTSNKLIWERKEITTIEINQILVAVMSKLRILPII